MLSNVPVVNLSIYLYIYVIVIMHNIAQRWASEVAATAGLSSAICI